MLDTAYDKPLEGRGSKDKFAMDLKKIEELRLLDDFEKHYMNKELQKVAKHVHGKWKPLHFIFGWDELHLEGCIRLTIKQYHEPIENQKSWFTKTCFNICLEIYNKEFKPEKVKKPKKANSITNTDNEEDSDSNALNTTNRDKRKNSFKSNKKGNDVNDEDVFTTQISSNRVIHVDPTELLLTSIDSTDINKWEILISILLRFGMPCGLLLFLFYLVDPPVKDKKRLFQIAVFFGANLQNPKGIDNKMTECRTKFREYAPKHPDFDDLLS